MKKIFITLVLFLLSFAAVANSVFPQVWNNGRSVSLNAWNTTEQQVRCSGAIYLDMSDNSRDTISVFEYIWPRGSLYRTYYPRFSTPDVRIQSVSHSVWCW
jgi:hypothetical protein